MKRLFALLVVITLGSPCYGALIHHYEFLSDANDSIGGANGTLHGDANVDGGILKLDGGGDYVQFNEHIVPTTGSYTVAFFGREDGRPESFGTMISQGWSTSVSAPPEGFYIGRASDDSLRVSDQNTGIPFPTGPTHYAFVVDATGSQSKLYIDGDLKITLGFALTTQPSGTDTRFGKQFESSAYNEYFHGALADIRIYDSVLTDAQIADLAGGTGIPAGPAVPPGYVPIPTAAWLFGSGLLGLVGIARHKKAV